MNLCTLFDKSLRNPECGIDLQGTKCPTLNHENWGFGFKSMAASATGCQKEPILDSGYTFPWFCQESFMGYG
jgi:hypothetical protein